MTGDRNRVCPPGLAPSLDGRIRRWLQDPATILAPYVRRGMTVLDIGCGPGLFSIEMARLIGERGQVVAADLQEAMLERLARHVAGTDLDRRIVRVKCERDRLNVSGRFDFVLAFYMVHEVPDQAGLFAQIRPLLAPDGLVLLVEPKLFHVSRRAWARTLEIAEASGFNAIEGPRLRFSWSAVLKGA